jgi:hypothetical protein
MMRGIVIWASEDRLRGLVWCEDQKELCQFGPESGFEDLGADFGPGALVEASETEVDGRRFASLVRHIGRVDLPSHLDHRAANAAGARRPRLVKA